jgi:hypothetical protein
LEAGQEVALPRRAAGPRRRGRPAGRPALRQRLRALVPRLTTLWAGPQQPQRVHRRHKIPAPRSQRAGCRADRG